ncbi:MAG: hypothetical protein ACE5IW_12700 [bacterium]
MSVRQRQNIDPDLACVGSKLKEDYMFHLIKAPPYSSQPPLWKDFKIDEEEVEAIVAYLRGVEELKAPATIIIRHQCELLPKLIVKFYILELLVGDTN